MRLDKLTRSSASDDLLTGIAPIYKVSFSGEAALIGTGFWVTTRGHLVTAKHVIDDNIGADGIDEGMIYAICVTPDRSLVARVFKSTYRHSQFDLALSETLSPHEVGVAGGIDPVGTFPLTLTLTQPRRGERVTTYAYVTHGQDFVQGKKPGITPFEMSLTMAVPDLGLVYDISFMTRLETGHVGEIFPELRDSVMLPFPCFQSDMPIYGANSGGPVFDSKGRVCGVNCSSYEGTDISFHVPTKSVADLVAFGIEFVPEDPAPRTRTIAELGLARRILFDPPAARALFPFWVRLLLWPKQQYEYAASWLRWRLPKRRSGARDNSEDSR